MKNHKSKVEFITKESLRKTLLGFVDGSKRKYRKTKVYDERKNKQIDGKNVILINETDKRDRGLGLYLIRKLLINNLPTYFNTRL